MFWKRHPAAVVPVAELISDSGTFTVDGPEDNFERQYEHIASKLGVLRRDTRWQKHRLRHFLYSEGVAIYPIESVSAWLEAHTPRGQYWQWFPLRSQDKSFMLMETTQSPTTNGTLRWQQYNKPVPLPVLLTVDRLASALPGHLCFFVSDIGAYPDPFLAVMERSDYKEFYIVERWDEPGFRR